MTKFGRNEQRALREVEALNGEADALAVRWGLQHRGYPMPGDMAINTTLNDLERKGFVAVTWVPVVYEGKTTGRKRTFAITPTGQQALDEARETGIMT